MKRRCSQKFCQNLSFNKVAGLQLATFSKESLAQVFTCEFIFQKQRPSGVSTNETHTGKTFFMFAEAATRGILQKKVFLEISQNSHENTCARVSFLIKLQASGLRCVQSMQVSEMLTLTRPNNTTYETLSENLFFCFFMFLIIRQKRRPYCSFSLQHFSQDPVDLYQLLLEDLSFSASSLSRAAETLSQPNRL